jgi:hypothetical protein
MLRFQVLSLPSGLGKPVNQIHVALRLTREVQKDIHRSIQYWRTVGCTTCVVQQPEDCFLVVLNESKYSAGDCAKVGDLGIIPMERFVPVFFDPGQSQSFITERRIVFIAF